MNRRTFLQSTPALLALPSLGRNAAQSVPQTVALIGCGWYGKSDLMRLLQVAEVEVVGLCDVDRHMLEEAASLLKERHPGADPKLYDDYQVMLRQARPDLVLIATPDHWHALQAIAAVEAGAHIYLQKPVGVDVRECEAVSDAVRKHDRTVQIGTQRRSTPHLIEAKEKIVEAGLLGTIGHVELCCYYHMRDTAVREVEEVPDFFDYARWTGPAPLLPYRGLPHRRWRAFQEYGNGIVGDMCVHMLDMTRWMLGLGYPREVVSTGGIYVQKQADATTTDTQTVTFAYPAFNVVWQHRSWGKAVDPDFPWAMTLYGDEGTLQADPYKYTFTPLKGDPITVDVAYEREAYPEDVTEKDIELHTAPATRAHLTDWLDAIATGRKPVADVEEGVASTISCILGNLSLDAGHPLRYDPAARTLLTHDDGLLSRTYRPPYLHP